VANTKIVSTVPSQAQAVAAYVDAQVGQVLAALRDRREGRVLLQMNLPGGRSLEMVMVASPAGVFALTNPGATRGTPLRTEIAPAVIHGVASGLGEKRVEDIELKESSAKTYADSGTYSGAFFSGASSAKQTMTVSAFNAYVNAEAAKVQPVTEQTGLLSQLSGRNDAVQQARGVLARMGAMIGKGGVAGHKSTATDSSSASSALGKIAGGGR